jgi:hypothetical protein
MAKAILPFYGESDDIEKILGVLRTKPTGVSHDELTRTPGKKYVDPRKFDFYDLLAFFSRSDGRFKLTQAGFAYLDGGYTERSEAVRVALRK